MDTSVPNLLSPALDGGGEMGSLIRAMDWDQTPLGPISGWPPSLLAAVSMILTNRLAMHIIWGPDLIEIYNDAYRPILGSKHPAALGRKAEGNWSEVWDFYGAHLRGLRLSGKATLYESQLFSVLRHGFLEECYFTANDSPIWDESGGIGGILNCVTETTQNVISERRLNLIQACSDPAFLGGTAQETADLVSQRLEAERLDIPFSLLYLLNERGNDAELAACSGIERDGSDLPMSVPLSDSTGTFLPLAEVASARQPVLAEKLASRFRPRPGAPWPEPCDHALVLPLKGGSPNVPAGILVLGISPRLPLDKAYREYLELVADGVAKALADTRAHAETDQQRTWLHALFMQAPALICILRGPEHVFGFANPLVYNLVNKTDLIGNPARTVFPELGSQGTFEILDRVYQGQAYTAQERRVDIDRGKGPEPLYFRITYQPMRNAQGDVEGILVFGLDVTVQVLARQKAEEASADLAAQKSILEAIAQRAPLPVVLETVTRNAESLFPDANAAILLVSSDGRLVNGAAPGLPGEYLRAMEGSPVGRDAGLCGTAAFTGVGVIVGDIASDPKWKNGRDPALAYGFKACWCLPILSPSGTILATFALFFREPRHPAYGELNRLATLTRTASLAIERRASEESLRRAQDQLLQAQKMESIGKLAGGIAHDFNNILTAINGYSELSLQLTDETSPVREYLSEIKNAGAKAADLTRQLLAYSRKQVLSIRIVDLNVLILDLGKLLKRLIGENIELDLALDPALRTIKVDPGKIEQVVLNLAVNARDAIGAGGRITIRTRSITVSKDNRSLAPGLYAMLAVQDNGTGMSAEVKAQVFEPFFTTKAFGKGSGLGLSTVYGIITQSGGRIFIESEPGKGSIFTVYFPVAEAGEPAAPAAPAEHGASSRDEATILLVEDETSVRRLVKQVLTDQGYRVLEGKDGAEGLEIGRGHPGTIDLVITDVVMPRMDGIQMIQQLRLLRPDVRVLFMSGYIETPVVQNGVTPTDSHFIQKPFLPHMILDEVRDLLSAKTR
ncbi:MAG: histidine kinase [Fibrobacteres bacterium]|nr:histidine kinase [Fibrobacterota bacterium]